MKLDNWSEAGRAVDTDNHNATDGHTDDGNAYDGNADDDNVDATNVNKRVAFSESR